MGAGAAAQVKEGRIWSYSSYGAEHPNIESLFPEMTKLLEENKCFKPAGRLDKDNFVNNVLASNGFKHNAQQAWNKAKEARKTYPDAKPWIYVFSLRWKRSYDPKHPEHGDGRKHHYLATEFQKRMEAKEWYTVINPNSKCSESFRLFDPGMKKDDWREWYMAHLALGLCLGWVNNGYVVLIQMGPKDGKGHVSTNENLDFERNTTKKMNIWVSGWNQEINAARAVSFFQEWADGITNHGWKNKGNMNLLEYEKQGLKGGKNPKELPNVDWDNLYPYTKDSPPPTPK